MSSPTDVTSRRLDLAGTRDFAVAGAGPARRAALSAFNLSWLAEVWQAATGGAQIEGIALAVPHPEIPGAKAIDWGARLRSR